MFVLHTTVSEVYDRLWVAHEADVGIDAALQIRGLFDMYRWSVEKFELISAVKTSEGTCSVEKDCVVIENLINQRGGYDPGWTVPSWCFGRRCWGSSPTFYTWWGAKDVVPWVIWVCAT